MCLCVCPILVDEAAEVATLLHLVDVVGVLWYNSVSYIRLYYVMSYYIKVSSLVYSMWYMVYCIILLI